LLSGFVHLLTRRALLLAKSFKGLTASATSIVSASNVLDRDP
jgi:hypothetical protein